MSAHIFANTQSIRDSARFTEYLRLASAIVTQYGGKFLGGGVGNTIEVADGDWLPAEVCAFGFENLQKAKEFYDSVSQPTQCKYTRLKNLRFLRPECVRRLLDIGFLSTGLLGRSPACYLRSRPEAF